MPNRAQIQHELSASAQQNNGVPDHDSVRRRHMARVHLLTGRPVILYYSNWTGSGQISDKAPIRLDDIHGFMGAVQDLDGSDLDLILHTPGGDPNTVETIVNYLRHKFDGELRAFVPLAAMSAGTMLALACDQIFMAAHSRLGPIDPQVLQPTRESPS